MVVVVVVVVGWGVGGELRQVCAPHHKNVCKILRLGDAIALLIFNKSLSNLVIVLFPLVSMDFTQLVHVKS